MPTLLDILNDPKSRDLVLISMRSALDQRLLQVGDDPQDQHAPVLHFERLEPIERLIIAARDLFWISNEEIANLLTDSPEEIAKRFDIPVDDVPPALASWPRTRKENNVQNAYRRAWSKLILWWALEENVLSELEYEVTYRCWVNDYSYERIADRLGLDHYSVVTIELEAARKIGDAMDDAF